MTINDERASEGVEHLQTAALELIAAARVFLDAAEELVHDRDRIHDVVTTITTLAATPGELLGRRRNHRPRPAPGPIKLDDDDDDDHDDVVRDGGDQDDDDGDARPPVQRIDVS